MMPFSTEKYDSFVKVVVWQLDLNTSTSHPLISLKLAGTYPSWRFQPPVKSSLNHSEGSKIIRRETTDRNTDEPIPFVIIKNLSDT